MSIEEFFPKYPNIDNSKYEVLNSYDDFYSSLYHKKEFYENRLEKSEKFPKEMGALTKHQKTIARYMSSYTPYDRILLIHSMGLGKTCSAVGAIEQIKSEGSTIRGALILAKGENLLDNFKQQVVFSCTSGYYIPKNFKNLTEGEKMARIRKNLNYYKFKTFARFAKEIKKSSDRDLIESYSNMVIVMDEIHNIRIQDKNADEIDPQELYDQYHRFFHLIQNTKVIFLSGTPMKDTVDEIATVCNLLLPLDKQFPTGKKFISEYMTEAKNTLEMKPEKIPEFKSRTKGIISFLREAESTVPREFIGEKNVGGLKHFIVAPNTMSSFQSKRYKHAFENDGGIYTDSREATLFVFPDGSYGRQGFNKYVLSKKKKVALKDVASGKKNPDVHNYELSDELKKELKGRTHEEILEKISKFSATYAQVIRELLNARGNCFVYSSIKQGSGCILFSLLLELFGFSKANGKETTKGLRYAILTDKTATDSEMTRIKAKFNTRENMRGDIIKIIIGSKAISEGFSFFNVIFEAILTPHWNYSETAQALARGIRLGSHEYLYETGEKPVVKIIQPVSIPNKKYEEVSVDLLMYKTSEDKEISIRKILRILMEGAVDCALNYMRNHVDGKDGSRECFYSKCNYTCDGINMDEIENGISEKDLDFSTYQLYYSDPKTATIKKKIERLFRENAVMDIESVIKNLSSEFTEEEIRNSLIAIKEETESEEFDYRTYLNIYSVSSVKKICNKVEELFKDNFKLDFSVILEQLKEYTDFEILSALNKMITESMVLLDKYGFPCYLREERNTYFLVGNISVNSDFYTEYYARYPHISAGKNFTDIMRNVYSLAIPRTIRKLCKTTNDKEFSRLIKTLPIEIQEMMIEASLVSRDKEIDYNTETRSRILDFFNSYIKKIGDTWVSTLDGKKVLRCGDVGADLEDWQDCDDKYRELVEKHDTEKKQKMREDNPYGIMGTYNPEKEDAFCLIDFQKEKNIIQKMSEKRKSSAVDKRLSHTGMVCSTGGWKLPELMNIAINRLKIEPAPEFRRSDSVEKMVAEIKKDAKLAMMFEKEVKEKDRETLRRILYWGSKKEKGQRGIKPICKAIKDWLAAHDLLKPDNLCGVRGKPKKLASKPAGKGTRVLRVEAIVPSKDREKFKEYTKDISRLMGECFNTKKYSAPTNDHLWLIVFSRKKMAGFLVLDENSVIWNVCVAKNYRNQGIATEIIKQAINYSCNAKGNNPSLLVDNHGENVKKLIKMYTSFGFKVIKTTDKHTYMSHSCKDV